MSSAINSEEQSNPFQTLFEGLPEQANHRLDALVEIHRSFKRELINQLRPIIRTLLQEKPPSDDNGRQELTHHLNDILHEVGLAIVEPSTGLPASVVAEPWRLRLQTRANHDGKRIRSKNTKSLPPLDLVEWSRPKPFLTWEERTSCNNPPNDNPPEDNPPGVRNR
jgi:hypothetical protein